MKIITWNVNGLRAAAKRGSFEPIQSLNPDLLCLQETKVHPDQVSSDIKELFEGPGYWSWADRPGYSGTATFSKRALRNFSRGIGVKKFDREGRFVITEHDDFLLYNVYFPNGGSGLERHLFKQEFLRRVLVHLKGQIRRGREVILVGDYNIAHREIDVYDPAKLAVESGFLPEERRWLDEFLEAGFVDLFRKFHEREPHRYTWWNNVERGRIGNRGWRIDYISATRKMAGRFKSCEILDEIPGSDHCPVVAEFV